MARKEGGESQMAKKRDDRPIIGFTRYITLKNGKRIYAWQKGLRAFPLRGRKRDSLTSRP